MLQYVLNGVITASVLGLAGLGFVFQHRLAKFFNFSYASTFLVAPYACWVVLQGLPRSSTAMFFVAALVGVGCSVLFGLALEISLFRRLRIRGGGVLVPLLVSLGAYVAVQNAISLFAGDDTKVVWSGPARTGREVRVGPAVGRITDAQLVTLAVTVLVGGATIAMVGKTNLGLVLRAVADDSHLARVQGLNTNVIHMYAQGVASAIAGVAGLCSAIQTDLNPNVGLEVLLTVAAVMAIGGVVSLPGVLTGALALGLLESFSPLVADNRWQDTIVFGLLLVLLVVRPSGLLGRITDS